MTACQRSPIAGRCSTHPWLPDPVCITSLRVISRSHPSGCRHRSRGLPRQRPKPVPNLTRLLPLVQGRSGKTIGFASSLMAVASASDFTWASANQGRPADMHTSARFPIAKGRLVEVTIRPPAIKQLRTDQVQLHRMLQRWVQMLILHLQQ